MAALIFTNDLIFSSRVSSIGQSEGFPVEAVGSRTALLQQAQAQPTELVILDLTSRGCDPSEIVPELRQLASPPKIVAYAPHVNEAQLAAAEQAQCDEVLTRGQFNSQIPQILARYRG